MNFESIIALYPVAWSNAIRALSQADRESFVASWNESESKSIANRLGGATDSIVHINRYLYWRRDRFGEPFPCFGDPVPYD